MNATTTMDQIRAECRDSETETAHIQVLVNAIFGALDCCPPDTDAINTFASFIGVANTGIQRHIGDIVTLTQKKEVA
jgi:hypothetical protein